jgi:hypothetical protein
VAIANKIARVIYKMITDSECRFRDPGPIKAQNPKKRINNLLAQLKNLGVDIEYHTEEKIVAKSSYQSNV